MARRTGDYRKVNIGTNATGKTSITIPGYLWDEVCRLMGDFEARQMVGKWRGVGSYEASARLFKMVMQAARQGKLPGMDE